MLHISKKQHSGFTLVEIMIVVAIIALLAAIAVPNFLRARKRSQATSTIQTLRMIDSAKDLYAIENNKSATTTPTGTDLLPYVKKDSKLYTQLLAGTPRDEVNNAITISPIDTPPKITAATRSALDDVLGDTTMANTFWGPYKL